MFISFSVKRFGPRFPFYLLFPEFSVLSLLVRSPAPTPLHAPPGVWSGNMLMVTASHVGSQKDGGGFRRVIPGCCPLLQRLTAQPVAQASIPETPCRCLSDQMPSLCSGECSPYGGWEKREQARWAFPGPERKVTKNQALKGTVSQSPAPKKNSGWETHVQLRRGGEAFSEVRLRFQKGMMSYWLKSWAVKRLSIFISISETKRMLNDITFSHLTLACPKGQEGLPWWLKR